MPADDLNPDPVPTDPAPATGRRRSRLLAPAAAVAAVTAVALGVGVAVTAGGSGDGSGGTPPPLHLVTYSEARTAPDTTTAYAGSAPVQGVTVVGTLPDRPRSAPVYSFPAAMAPRERVVALARALGLAGDPTRAGDRWLVRDGDRALWVDDRSGWQWTLGGYDRAVPAPMPVDPEQPAQSEPVPPASPVPLPSGAEPGSGPIAACDAVVNGRRVCPTPLRPGGGGVPGDRLPEQPGSVPGAGVTIPNTAVDEPGTAPGSTGGGSSGSQPASTGSADPNGASSTSVPLPPVGGSTAVPVPPGDTRPAPSEQSVRNAARGVLTMLGLTGGRVTTSLGQAVLVVDPIVDGRQTEGVATVLGFDADARLTTGSGWLAVPARGAEYPLATARDALVRASRATCEPCPRPTEVTGARLGLLAMTDDHNRLLLVPAWLYEASGLAPGMPPLAAVAVAPRYLAPPRSDDPPGAGSGPGQAGSAEPAEPAGPGTAVTGSAGQAGPGVAVTPAPPAHTPTR